MPSKWAPLRGAPIVQFTFKWYATPKEYSFAAAYDEYRLLEYPVISRYIVTAWSCIFSTLGFTYAVIFVSDTVMRH